MDRKEVFFRNLDKAKQKKLLAHFNTIYTNKVDHLNGDAMRVIYLAWLWKKGLVIQLANGLYVFDEDKAGIPLTDFESIHFDETAFVPYSYNLESIYMHYKLERIMEIL